MKINGYEIKYNKEELRRKIERETLDVELISPGFEGFRNLSEGNQKALRHLVAAAKIINDVSLEQDHPLNRTQKKALEEAAAADDHAALALALFNSLNGVAGFNGIDKEPVEIFEGIHLLPGHNFYPADMSAEEFQKILLSMLKAGKSEEVASILSARTMVRRQGNELMAVDYTEYFAKEFSLAANELEVAAHYADDVAFRDYLGWQAQALLQNNPEMDMLADRHWAVLQDSPLEFTLSRENYDDEITPAVYDNEELKRRLEENGIEAVSKDTLGARVGIVNKKGTELILQFKKHLPELALKMPFAGTYHQHILDGEELKQTMVDVDLADLEGDYAQCRGGITTAQNLPNNDKLSVKTGGGRRNVYHRQVRMSVDKEKERKLLERLVDPALHRYFDSEADHLFVIGHENGHSLGPDSSYQNALGTYKHIIEEHKADTVSLAFMPEYVRAGIIDEETLKKIYVSYICGRMFLTARPHLMLPHRMGELIQFNYLCTNGIIQETKDGKITIDLDNVGNVLNRLLEETIRIQLSKSKDDAAAFVEKYTEWSSLSQKIAAVRQELGVKPYKRIVRHF